MKILSVDAPQTKHILHNLIRSALVVFVLGISLAACSTSKGRVRSERSVASVPPKRHAVLPKHKRWQPDLPAITASRAAAH